jgi:2-succinyl-6-hydroxy-2,4-cyclohexadiene-1-carboxylate synthase
MSLLGLQRHGSGPTFVWLHGFTQTRDSAHQFRSILTGTYELLTLDLPGHGENARITASLAETADLLADTLPDRPFVLGGYSLGARVARVRQVVLLGASRGIEDLDQRALRRRSDEALADRVEAVGTSIFLDEWLAQPMFAGLPLDPLERRARSTDPHGLASSLRRSGTGTQEWLGARLATLDVPTFALAGEEDDKFLIEAAAIAEGVARGALRVVAGAHHATHLERPELTARAIEEFTARF